MKASVFVAQSLDGYLARGDGSVDWLGVPDENEDYGFAAFMGSIDALVMGRNTYDTVVAMGEWPYGEKPVIVLSHRPVPIPSGLTALVEASDMAPAELAGELDRRGIEHVYVDGGKTIQSFLDAGLIGRMTITTIPVLIGDGIPVFGATDGDIRLRLVDSIAYTNGLVQSTYDVV